MTKEREDLYRAAIAADAAWSKALVERYGKAAGDARYDERGVSTPQLLELAAAKLKADEALRCTCTGTHHGANCTTTGQHESHKAHGCDTADETDRTCQLWRKR